MTIRAVAVMAMGVACGGRAGTPRPSDPGGGPPPGPDMVTVPPGAFMMGCNIEVDPLCQEDEYPMHPVWLSPYQIDRTEVTQAAYARCVERGACKLPQLEHAAESAKILYDPLERGSYPITNIPWEQADAYCRWAGKRLPTEAEWEKAARGIDGRMYPWGNYHADCTFVNYCVCSAGSQFSIGPHPVGSHPAGASPYGALDLSGNVHEFVSDFYDPEYYRRSPLVDPTGGDGAARTEAGPIAAHRPGSASGKTPHIRRGGSFWHDRRIHSSSRSYYGYGVELAADVGFRCARSLSGAAAPGAAAPPPARPAQTAALNDMVRVPAGEFWMGCGTPREANQCDVNEYPYHKLTLSGFEVDRNEVTQAMYEQCAVAGRCTRPPGGSFAPEQRPNFPVGAVTWEQAWTFCDWAGKRLPTEAEFEKASRGVDGRVFPWGAQEPDCSRLNNYACGAFVRPVGSYPGGASPYGAKDLSGNVWEWVSDWYEQDYYSITPERDPLGPSSGPVRVRGGGSIVLRIPTHYRRGDSDIVTAMPFAGLGFRCVRGLPHDEAADAAPAGTRAGVPAAETREGWKALRAYERAAAIFKQKDPLPAKVLLEARSYATECWSQANRVRDLVGGSAAGKPLYDPGKEMFKTADGSLSLAAMLDRCIEMSRDLGQRKGEGCGVKRVTIVRVKDGLKDFSDPRVYADAVFTEKDCRLMPRPAPLPEPPKRVAPELEKLCGAGAVFVFGDDGLASEQRIYLVSRLLQTRVNGSCWQRGTLDFAPTAWPLPGL